MELRIVKQIIKHGRNIKRLNELELSLAGHQYFLSGALQNSLASLFETHIIPSEGQLNINAIASVLENVSDSGELVEKWYCEYGNVIDVLFSWKKTYLANKLFAFSLDASIYPDNDAKTSFVYRFTENTIDIEISGDYWL